MTYADATMLPRVIVMRIWLKGYESFTGWLGRNPALAASLGYTTYDRQGQLQTISQGCSVLHILSLSLRGSEADEAISRRQRGDCFAVWDGSQ